MGLFLGKKGFWNQVDKSAGEESCWLWKGFINSRGYGERHFMGRTYRAHRVSYIYAYGKISDGLTIDHLCRIKNCVNPKHLEAVTLRENILRGKASVATNKSHCNHGHSLNGKKKCLECVKRWNKEQYLKRMNRRRRDE